MPPFNQCELGASAGLELVENNLWTFQEPVFFSTALRATTVPCHYVTVYVSTFPAASLTASAASAKHNNSNDGLHCLFFGLVRPNATLTLLFFFF